MGLGWFLSAYSSHSIHGRRETFILNEGVGFVLAISWFLRWFRERVVVGSGLGVLSAGINVVGEVGLGWGLYRRVGY